MNNQRPSGPVCQNCALTQIYCECVRDMERRKCCEQCEHHELPPDIRVD